ncbi:hypothetical protein [Deefgea piscis]|nr:hypothetical protein [Deefgea piscis]
MRDKTLENILYYSAYTIATANIALLAVMAIGAYRFFKLFGGAA